MCNDWPSSSSGAAAVTGGGDTNSADEEVDIEVEDEEGEEEGKVAALAWLETAVPAWVWVGVQGGIRRFKDGKVQG